ncbi:hypothetical protein STEG23_013443 [Scotinomys teguina]
MVMHNNIRWYHQTEDGDEEGQNQVRHQPVTEEARHVENKCSKARYLGKKLLLAGFLDSMLHKLDMQDPKEDITLSDSAEDELDSEEEEDLEEAVAAYEREREYPQVRIIHYMDDILLAAPSQVMLDKAYAYTVQALEKKGLYIAPEKDQEKPIWIPERLTRFIRHEDPDPDTSDKPDSSPDQSRTGDAVVGSDQNVADSDASEC